MSTRHNFCVTSLGMEDTLAGVVGWHTLSSPFKSMRFCREVYQIMRSVQMPRTARSCWKRCFITSFTSSSPMLVR